MVDDLRIDVRFNIATLWAATLFLFAYGDIFGFSSKGFRKHQPCRALPDA